MVSPGPGRFWLAWQNWHDDEWTAIVWDTAVMSALPCFD